MTQHRFPLYRRLGKDLSWYRVESETAFTEVQRVGSRFVQHAVLGSSYPERVRIAELVAMDDAALVAVSEEEFEAARSRSQE